MNDPLRALKSSFFFIISEVPKFETFLVTTQIIIEIRRL